MKPIQSVTQAAPQLLDVREVAKQLSISTRQVYSLVARGVLPSPVRIGGSTRWRFDEITAWIEAGCPRWADRKEGGR